MHEKAWSCAFIVGMVIPLGLFVGCGEDADQRRVAGSIADQISETCGTTENREAGGPRTITAIDLDGSYGPEGYLVTCVNGKTAYVKAPS